MADFKSITAVMHEALQQNAVFGQLLSKVDREFLLHRSVIRSVKPGDVICAKQQYEHSLFLLIMGRVEITSVVKGKTISLAMLSSGELFGEISALFMTPRIATATASTASVLLEIPSEVMRDLMEQAPVIKNAVLHRYRYRTLETTIRAVPLFTELPPETVAPLIDNAELLTYAKDTPILHQGEAGDAFYIINYGVARVHIEVGDYPLNVALLRNGDYFGEWSLLSTQPRVASITALTAVEVVAIAGKVFLDFIATYPQVHEQILQVAHERRSKTLSVYQSQIQTTEEMTSFLNEVQAILSATPA